MNYRKIVYIILLVLISLSIFGCESKAERRAREERNRTIFIVIVIAGLSIWGIKKRVNYLDENKDRWAQEKEEREQQRLEADQQRQLLIEQKEQEELHADNISRLAEEAARNKLITYINEIMRYAMMLPSPEGNDKQMAAINDTIDNIISDSDIQKTHYALPIIQNDKTLLFEHFEECELTNHLAVKRLKGLFSVNEA